MKIFLDTANLDEIGRAADIGLIDGVTTNPTLIAREGRGFRAQISAICARVPDGDVSAETVSTDWEGMLREGREIATWASNVVVKVPCTTDGLRAARALTDAGVPVNVTLVFSAAQGLLACKSGARYVSPFVGRLDDTGTEGLAVVRDLVSIVRNYGFVTEVLASSLRTPNHVVAAAVAGAGVGTLPPALFHQLYKHPLTDAGMARFLDDWRALPRHEEATFRARRPRRWRAAASRTAGVAELVVEPSGRVPREARRGRPLWTDVRGRRCPAGTSWRIHVGAGHSKRMRRTGGANGTEQPPWRRNRARSAHRGGSSAAERSTS